MRVQEHIKLSTAAAIAALPWLKKDVCIPLAASILIDADHYLWHAVTHRTLSLKAAGQYFLQADPPRLAQQRLLHTTRAASNILDRYNPRHFVVLCSACHERAHKKHKFVEK